MEFSDFGILIEKGNVAVRVCRDKKWRNKLKSSLSAVPCVTMKTFDKQAPDGQALSFTENKNMATRIQVPVREGCNIQRR